MMTRNDDCTTCGGFGYTIDTTEEGEVMTGCFECSVAAMEEDTEFMVLLDDGDEVELWAATAEDAMDMARERGYNAAEAVAA